MNSDPVIIHLDLIARALEAMGYAVEVDYTSATIIVWLDEWPITIEVKRRKGTIDLTGFRKNQTTGSTGDTGEDIRMWFLPVFLRDFILSDPRAPSVPRG